jgi:3'-phosphoadenosine 5'-phosphosulfate sulfotransferase (PAPS reductase)/FAD synthetase
MSDPFLLGDPPALISFSGGRTSAYMLRRALDACGGTLPQGFHVCFSNTGKEVEGTLEFVRECGERWGVHINWLEFVARKGSQYRVVDFGSASRNGEPFEAVIREKKYIPNSLTRFCTSELKIMPKRQFMRDRGCPVWTNAIGIRADEPKRIKSFRLTDGEEFNVFPLADAGVTKPMILDWWSRQPFDLRIGENEGNCDLCFLKGQRRVRSVLEHSPERARWWIEQEERVGHWFMKGRKSYSHLLQIAQQDSAPECTPDDSMGECTCDVQ